MKRIKILAPVALLLLVTLILLLSLSPKSDANAPAFIAWHNQPLPPFLMARYDSGGPNPFVGDKMWLRLMSRSTTNTPFVLYDLENHIPLGELKNADAVIANHDHSKLLCYRHHPSSPQWKEKVSRIISKVTFGKVNLDTNTFTQPLWILDREHNSARKIGELSQLQGNTSFFQSSPGSRYAYTVPTASDDDQEFFLFDFKTETLRKIKLDGQLIGWWDDHCILVRDSGNNFLLFDVDSHTDMILWTAPYLTQQLSQLGISGRPDDLKVILNWNGHENDFYFDLTRNRPTDKPGRTPFLKADHTTRTLNLLYPENLNFNYKFEGDLDPTGTYYVYSGRKNGNGDGSVHLRDIRNNTEKLLVPPTVTGGNICLAQPRFYHDSVIYFRGIDLWRIDLTGSNNAPLFPQPTTPSR